MKKVKTTPAHAVTLKTAKQTIEAVKPKRQSGWSAERRKQQSEAIRRWQPWQHSTGAKTEGGKAIVARNAYRGAKRLKFRMFVKSLKVRMKYINAELDNCHNSAERHDWFDRMTELLESVDAFCAKP